MSIMKMVYQAGLNNGLSPNQARAFTAEVGRENDFNPNFIFGEHRDSNRDNVGIISWNQGRRNNLYNFLQKKGIKLNGNQIERSQRSLDAQMGFAIHEMKTNPAYKATKRIFLGNPNIDYRTAEKVLGKNFIRWDYAGNSLGANAREHHNKRDKYFAQLGGQDFSKQQAQQQDPRLSMSAPNLLASLRKSKGKRSDNDIFIELANNNGLAGREINHLLNQGADPLSIAKDLGLNISVAQQAQAAQQPDVDLPDIGAGYEDFMANFEAQDAPETAMPDIGKGYDDFMANLQIDEPQQEQAQQFPEIGSDYQDFMSKLDLGEQPTQAGDAWQTQNNKLEVMSQPKNAKGLPMQQSSWESLN